VDDGVVYDGLMTEWTAEGLPITMRKDTGSLT